MSSTAATAFDASGTAATRVPMAIRNEDRGRFSHARQCSSPAQRATFAESRDAAGRDVGGMAFTLTGVPAGLVTGSMLAVAVAALAGRPMQVPRSLARVCIVLVGIVLGAVVTPETLKGIADLAASVALLGVRVACHDRGHALSALRAWLGSAVGIARRKPRLDGAGDGALGGVQGAMSAASPSCMSCACC